MNPERPSEGFGAVACMIEHVTQKQQTKYFCVLKLIRVTKLDVLLLLMLFPDIVHSWKNTTIYLGKATCYLVMLNP